MGPIYSLDDFLDMVRRHARLIFGLVLLGCIASLIFAHSQSRMYRSAEVIQIERPKIANDLAPSTVAGSSARRLQLIQQQIMARGSLLQVIEKFDLYADLPSLTTTEKVNLLRSSVRIEGVAAVREGFADDGTIAVLTITADMETPEQAQAVAREISDRTIALSAESRSEQTRATLDFFARQEDALKIEIAVLEKRISTVRAANDMAIPGSIEFRRNEIAVINGGLLDLERQRITLQQSIDQIDRNARRATLDRRLSELNAQLESLDQQRALLTERAAALAQSLETSPEIKRELDNYDRQLSQLQTQLNVIAARRAEAEVGERLEARNNAETLTVLEPASLPEQPFTASRKKRALTGGVASVLAALGAAFLLDLRKPVIRSAEQMQREVGITPVVSIPVMTQRRPSLLDRTAGRIADMAEQRRGLLRKPGD